MKKKKKSHLLQCDKNTHEEKNGIKLSGISV